MCVLKAEHPPLQGSVLYPRLNWWAERSLWNKNPEKAIAGGDVKDDGGRRPHLSSDVLVHLLCYQLLALVTKMQTGI